ncbi:MAG: hypothetical protein ABGY41_10190 [Candidatus Poribacteria bacterium]
MAWRRPVLNSTTTVGFTATAILFLIGAVAFANWTPVGRSLFHVNRVFDVYEHDGRIVYAPSAELAAETVAAALPQAVAAVEAVHGRPFERPVSVVVCASRDQFSAFVPMGKGARGATFLNRVYLSPKAFETGTSAAILVHELSHLHLRQALGAGSMYRGIPAWFTEGLAVDVLAGGGAEVVPAADARAAILGGRTFTPESAGTWLAPKDAKAHGIPHHLFYRQAGLFVEYLRKGNPDGFRRLMAGLYDHGSFRRAFELYGDGDTSSYWDQFINAFRAAGASAAR